MKSINFNNTEIAFQVKTDKELSRAFFLFRLISKPWLISIGNSLLQFLEKLGLPVRWLVKPVIYKLFVGGETIEECSAVIEKLRNFMVNSILDYSVEGKESDDEIELAVEETMKSIKFAGNNKDIPFAVFKPSAFIKSQSLENLSNPDKDLNDEDYDEGEKFRQRVDRFCHLASSYNLPVLIDAEFSFYQNFIDQVVYEMQKKYNRDTAIVFNTYQMYRWDRLNILKQDIERARSEGIFLGAKFVRGAYMEYERSRALSKGYIDPIHHNKEATDKDFNRALELSIENLDILSLFNGTHNESSTNYMVNLMDQNKVEASDTRCWFSQLYGMSDHISYNLAKEGYNVVKYLPYGPIKNVLPYLIRRIEENTSVRGQTSRELTLIRHEVTRRKQQYDN